MRRSERNSTVLKIVAASALGVALLCGCQKKQPPPKAQKNYDTRPAKAVPAYLKGTYDVLPLGTMWPRFRPVTVFYGDPITFSRNGENKEAKQFYQEVSRTVIDRIASLGAVESPVQQSTAGIRNAE